MVIMEQRHHNFNIKKALSPFVWGSFLTALVLFLVINFFYTNFAEYKLDFFFWASIITTLTSVWQYFESRNQSEKAKSQVKIWMQDAKHLSSAIEYLFETETEEAKRNPLYVLKCISDALYTSLYEERVIDEREYAEQERSKSSILHRKEMTQMEDGVEIGHDQKNPIQIKKNTNRIKK